jgi:hypothetical protein
MTPFKSASDYSMQIQSVEAVTLVVLTVYHFSPFHTFLLAEKIIFPRPSQN